MLGIYIEIRVAEKNYDFVFLLPRFIERSTTFSSNHAITAITMPTNFRSSRRKSGGFIASFINALPIR